ncbi:RNI-like protein [Ramaria rubella]|nr:RNI-like protein [Ramaria rubella]
MTLDSQLPTVGTRINHNSNLGTIRFVGPVDGTKGIWLGVEWDDSQRGKHSGTKNGKQYFTCNIANSGSFIRPGPSIVLGRSFLEALSSKYIEIPLEMSTEKVMLGSSNGAIEVEAVGMNKVRSKLSRLGNLREVSLDKENVARADDNGQIRLRCPNIKGLDLSRSLIPTWEELARIVGELTLLETLGLNFNRLGKLPPLPDFGMAFANVLDVRLNGTLITWEDMLRLLSSFSRLQNLELGLNDLQNLSPPPLPFTTNLATLNLEKNRISHWESTMKSLVLFKRLDRLILSENKIQRITKLSSTGNLSQIQHLALASNGIGTWSDIDALPAWFPYLKTLNINNNPISQDTASRALIIARLPCLLTLNASAISSAERRDSELFYLSHIVKIGPSAHEDRVRDYPQYQELCEKHGRPADKQEFPPDTLKNRLFGTHFYRSWDAVPPTPDFDLSKPEFTLRVLPSMSLRVLRMKVLKTLKLPPQTQIQMWLALERGTLRDFAKLDMDIADRPLEFWGPDENSKIVYYVW